MIKHIHFKALAVWAIYSVVTKAAFLIGISETVKSSNAYLVNIFLNVVFGILFLYLFSHEDFFKFAREIERKNIKKEKKLEHRFLHYGKLVSGLLIGILSGPLIGALALRFLLPKYRYKYLMIILSSATSSALWLGMARGVIIWHLPF
jgi:hypothetical protein